MIKTRKKLTQLLVLLGAVLVTLFAFLFLSKASPVPVAAASNYEVESNDSKETANYVDVNSTVYGNLSKSSDVDWYTFTTDSDGYFNVDFQHALINSSNNYWRVYIYDSTGINPIDGDKDYWSIDGNSDTVLPTIGVPAGTYYVKIVKGTYYNSADYNFNLQFVGTDYAEKENNNTVELATELDVNTSYKASISKDSDVDWFKFTVKTAGYFNVDFQHALINSSNNYWRVYIYDSTGINPIDGDKDYWSIDGNSDTVLPTIGVAAGTYYIKVTESVYYSNADYDINLQFIGTDYAEKENNNTVELATELDVNTSYKASISKDSDVDWYKFTVKTAGYFNVDFQHESLTLNNSYWRIYIYDSTGVDPIDGDKDYWSVKGQSNAVLPTIGVAAGTYYIKVTESVYYSNADYDINLQFVGTNYAEKENNNTFEQATKLEVNNTYKGSISKSDDIDWYKFTVTKTGYFNVDFQHELPSLSHTYWQIYMYDSTATNSLDGNTGYWGIDESNAVLPTIGVAAGTYYIKITDSTYHSNVDYDINVRFTACEQTETENNGNNSAADPIQLNKTYVGSLSSSKDIDWFEFYADTTGTYALDLHHVLSTSSNTYWRVYLYDSSLNYPTGIKSYWSAKGNAYMQITDISLTGGTYYVKIDSGTYYNGGDYALTVKNESADADYPSNATPNTATSISVNDNWQGAISAADDVDWYRFTTYQAGYVSVNFTHSKTSGSGECWRISLYDSTGNYLVDGSQSSWTISGNKNKRTPEIGLPAGTYYFKVEAGSATYSEDPYAFIVNFTKTSYAEQEKDNVSSSATQIALNQLYLGSTSHIEDADWYQFTLPCNGNVDVTFWNKNAGNTNDLWLVYLYDQTGYSYPMGVGEPWSMKGNTFNITSAFSLAEGTYYLKVIPFNESNYSDSSYYIGVDFQSFTLLNVAFGQKEITINKGSTEGLDLIFYPANASNKTVTWISNNTSVATVSANGVVTANRYGTATITAISAEGGHRAQIVIHVLCGGDHAYEVKDTSTLYLKSAATCTEKAVYYYACYCGAKSNLTYEYGTSLSHDYRTEVTAPTCTELGYTTYTCNRCKDSYVQDYLPALNHNYNKAMILPTCTEQGYTAYTCSACGDIYKDDYVDALGHGEISHSALAPTCTQVGWNAYVTCSRCDYTTYEELAATGHDYTVVVTPPTCTEKGYTTYTCHCRDSYVGDYVDALGHEEIPHSALAPTCTQMGWNAYVTCSRCDYTTYEELAATGHDYIVVVTHPTCTERGYTTYTCHCKDTYVDKYVAPLGHSPAAVEENEVEPTCTKAGSYEAVVYCLACQEELSRESKVLPALGHEEIPHSALAPTCTQVGWNAYVTCSRCDYTTYEELAATGHSHTAVVTEPTCTEKGYTAHTCRCGDTYKDSYVDALGHMEVTDEAVAPTCTATGLTEGSHCSVCKEVLVAQQIVNETGHTPGEWIVNKPATESAEGERHKLCGTCGEVVEREILPMLPASSEEPNGSASEENSASGEEPKDSVNGGGGCSGRVEGNAIALLLLFAGVVLIRRKQRN